MTRAYDLEVMGKFKRGIERLAQFIEVVGEITEEVSILEEELPESREDIIGCFREIKSSLEAALRELNL